MRLFVFPLRLECGSPAAAFVIPTEVREATLSREFVVLAGTPPMFPRRKQSPFLLAKQLRAVALRPPIR